MEFLKDLSFDIVNDSNCSNSDAVHLAYLLFSRDHKNFVHQSDVILGEDECNVMEEPF